MIDLLIFTGPAPKWGIDYWPLFGLSLGHVVRLQDYASDPGVSVDKTKEESLQIKRLALSKQDS